MKEVWKNIPGFEGVAQVSNLGNLRRVVWKNRVFVPEPMAPLKRSGKYLFFSVAINNKRYHVSLADLVYRCFVSDDNCHRIAHIDGNTFNNVYTNLTPTRCKIRKIKYEDMQFQFLGENTHNLATLFGSDGSYVISEDTGIIYRVSYVPEESQINKGNFYPGKIICIGRISATKNKDKLVSFIGTNGDKIVKRVTSLAYDSFFPLFAGRKYHFKDGDSSNIRIDNFILKEGYTSDKEANIRLIRRYLTEDRNMKYMLEMSGLSNQTIYNCIKEINRRDQEMYKTVWEKTEKFRRKKVES